MAKKENITRETKNLFATAGRYMRDIGWLFLTKKLKKERIEYAKQLIRALPTTHKEIKLITIGDKIGFPGVPYPKLVKLVEQMIRDGEIDAQMHDDLVVFQKDSLEITLPPEAQELLEIIKSNTDEIKSDLEANIVLIESYFDKQDDLEEFLRERLASDFAKIKDSWQQFKSGEINRKELIKKGMAVFGKKFVKIIVRKS